MDDDKRQEEVDAKLRIKEFRDVSSDALIYRSRVTVRDPVLELRVRRLEEQEKDVPAELAKRLADSERHLYIVAERYNGDGRGFTLRYPERMDKDGFVHPQGVTGGGENDRVCRDLYDGRLFVERSSDFDKRWERIQRSQVPSALRAALPREAVTDEEPKAAAAG